MGREKGKKYRYLKLITVKSEKHKLAAVLYRYFDDEEMVVRYDSIFTSLREMIETPCTKGTSKTRKAICEMLVDCKLRASIESSNYTSILPSDWTNDWQVIVHAAVYTGVDTGAAKKAFMDKLEELRNAGYGILNSVSAKFS